MPKPVKPFDPLTRRKGVEVPWSPIAKMGVRVSTMPWIASTASSAQGEVVPMPRAPAKVEIPSPFTFRRFAIDAEPVVEALRAVMRPEKFPAIALRSPRDSREPERRWRVVSSPPAKVDVPSPFTFRRFPMENDVDDAMGRMEDPVTVRPP